jgi:hypothetical protein
MCLRLCALTTTGITATAAAMTTTAAGAVQDNSKKNICDQLVLFF